MSERLTPAELCALVTRVFAPGPADTALALLVDLPDQATPDTPTWRARRVLAADWAVDLAHARDHGLVDHRPGEGNERLAHADLATRKTPTTMKPMPTSFWMASDSPKSIHAAKAFTT